MSKALKSSVFRMRRSQAPWRCSIATPAFAGRHVRPRQGAETTRWPARPPPRSVSSKTSSRRRSVEGKRQARPATAAVAPMEIQPGGIVPLHSHADSSGADHGQRRRDLREQRQVPRADPASRRRYLARVPGHQHWWKNEGKTTVVLTIADIVNDHKPETMMQQHVIRPRRAMTLNERRGARSNRAPATFAASAAWTRGSVR